MAAFLALRCRPFHSRKGCFKNLEVFKEQGEVMNRESNFAAS